MAFNLPVTSDKTTSAELRKEVLAKRDGLSDNERRIKSERIIQRLLDLDTIPSCNSILLYVNFRSEVHTVHLLDELLSMNKTVAVPKTYSREHRIAPIVITDPGRQLVPGYCNIPEPISEILTTNHIPTDDLDLVIVPGSVFDEGGGRLGYGGGYYDRLLSAIPRAIRIGLAFDVQIVRKIPLQPHDELLDMVITESRIIQTNRLLL